MSFREIFCSIFFFREIVFWKFCITFFFFLGKKNKTKTSHFIVKSLLKMITFKMLKSLIKEIHQNCHIWGWRNTWFSYEISKIFANFSSFILGRTALNYKEDFSMFKPVYTQLLYTWGEFYKTEIQSQPPTL